MTNEEQSAEKTTNRRRKAKRENEHQVSEVKIIVKRHQQLFELLNDPHRMWRVLLSLFLIIVVLFVGIAFVVMSIKKYYPYSMVMTNLEGASIMKSEDKDVSYWLFNSADLWANSGIEVQKGDELSIYASGASYTAIHHLTDASRDNKRPDDKWVDTGGQENTSERNKKRALFRINKDCDEGTLLMQIVNKDSVSRFNDEDCPEELLRGQHVEIIGKGRSRLRISHDGVLCFAVNDIVLTDTILSKMYKEWLHTVTGDTARKEAKDILTAFYNIKDDASFGNNIKTLKNKNKTYKDYSRDEKSLDLGHYPVLEKNDSTYYKCYPLVNELVYYRQKKFRDAWYMDNLGSFLIVIERKK